MGKSSNFLLNSCWFINKRNYFSNLNPIKYEGLNHSIFFFVISYPLSLIGNLIIPKKIALTYVVERWGNQMDRLFWLSLNQKNDAKKLLMITLNSGKVYVAWVNKISEPIGDAYVTLIPIFSGYRDSNTKIFEITTNYLSALESLINADQESEIDDQMGITIPKKEISMVSKFEIDIFSNHFL